MLKDDEFQWSVLLTAADLRDSSFAGFLYLLCFERVNNLRAYSIPLETGFLIPSDYASVQY
jgi:hypothetical protein